ncbi:putative long-chain-alcohol O-fatty-acyltransferase 4 [Morella rubra]|uniref:Putative long-chain-alcohol O-fatty-acyltransferase 4 n=1 Tax=Morella rubra TaxID=262757 RepID=A0A6A1WQ98_9ROSI|nr:putative long-chain-alcohol O-fatty-acyltransferase 4 [Morella rubra]
MEAEINKFIKVWLAVFLSLSCCYRIGKVVPKGPVRLLCVLPIICFFLFLPINLQSVHLGGTTAFFIAWLANFKLLLFCFGKGPLCSDPSISLARFLAVGCFPIKIQQNVPPKPLDKPRNTPNKIDPSRSVSFVNGKNKENPPPKPLEKPEDTNPPSSLKSYLNGQHREYPTSTKSKTGHIFPPKYATMGLLLAILIRVYDYREHIHPKVILVLYCLHIYLFLEVILAMVTASARGLLGLELEPQFNDPYLTTSLQDFWGRRWNLMVTNILRQTVYKPTLHAATSIIGSRWAPPAAIFATFVVSGLMHELMFYYLGQLRPTWEVTWFFILHGCCLTVEVALKAIFNRRWQLPRLISGILTIGFVIVSSFWLFFPQFLRFKADERAFAEYAALGEFFKHVTLRIL